MAASQTTVLVVDDHQIVRQGLKAILNATSGIKYVGEASDGLEAITQVEKHKPDVVVVDLMIPGLNGLEVIKRLARKTPHPAIVALSMHSTEAYVVEALRAGATAYVVKESGSQELIEAIKAAKAGKRYLSPPLSEQVVDAYSRRSRGGSLDLFQTLTDREKEVLQLTVEGNSCSEIAGQLHISARTVESHRANLMKKLGVRNQKDLVRIAVQHQQSAPKLK